MRYFQIQILITLAGLIAIVQLPGQGGFNITYENPYGETSGMRFEDVIISNDTLTLIGTFGDDSLQTPGIIVAQIDTFGNILKWSIIIDTTGNSWFITDPQSQTMRSSRGTYLVPVIDFRNHNPHFAELNSNLDIINLFGYALEDIFMVPLQVIEMSHGTMILGWIQRNNYYVMPFALAVDDQGKETWRRYIGDPNTPHTFCSALKLNDNEFIIGYGVLGNSTGEEDGIWSQPKIIAIDSLGKTLWEWTGEVHEGNGWIPWNLRRTSDGGWLYTPRQRHLIEPFPGIYESFYSPMLIKRDSAMNLDWIVDYDKGPRSGFLTHFTDAFIDDEDHVFMAGQRGKFYDEDIALVGWVIKASALYEEPNFWEVTDTGLWNPNWSQSFLTGITASKFGTVFACGRTSISGESQAWLIKVTADGCIDTLCNLTSIAELVAKDQPEFLLFPNPNRGSFTIEVAEGHDSDCELLIMDILGHTVFKERFHGTSNFDFSGQYSPGMYVYSIWDTESGKYRGSGKLMIE
ncbi:MAG: hypothetical protein DRI69_07190 [Bacteroidetes bacterium]|nr:MAG: hypothetical protein DRI69_07190 [Bacteroidota bacterium]